MTTSEKKAAARKVLDTYGRSYADEAGIDLRDAPSPLFRLLCLSLLLSARIRSDIAVQAARALSAEGWRTPRKLAESSWERRAQVLNEAGYARYDERTARMVADAAELLLDRWRGDLRRLRAEAERDPGGERTLLQEFPGIGPTGADIFAREVQAVWTEHFPHGRPPVARRGAPARPGQRRRRPVGAGGPPGLPPAGGRPRAARPRRRVRPGRRRLTPTRGGRAGPAPGIRAE